MVGSARAPAAGTVLNALATGCGSAFAIDEYVRAEVDLNESGEISGEVDGAPDTDTTLVETCVRLVVERYGTGEGGHVWTESDVPMAGGLKSSSAAANATVLATLDALGAELSRVDACRLGVTAAREAGVTITGAFDDASASMLGGVTVTDNESDELLSREELDHAVLVYAPDSRAFSADADVSRCKKIAPVAELVAELALDGRFATAMTVNGFAFCSALGFPSAPLVDALPDAAGVSLSGTGPSYTAIGTREELKPVVERWSDYEGTTWLTETQTEGARRT